MNHRSWMRRMCLVLALLLCVPLCMASVTAQCMDGEENETRTSEGTS